MADLRALQMRRAEQLKTLKFMRRVKRASVMNPSQSTLAQQRNDHYSAEEEKKTEL